MESENHFEQGPESDGVASPPQSSGLLQARRKFLTGSVAISGFAATLASRPALANGGNQNWVYGEVQAVCSVHASHPISLTGCSGYHTDYFSCNTSNWGGWSHTSQKFSSCGWTPTVATCGFSDTYLWDCINACYTGSASKGYTYKGSSSQSTLNAAWIACGFVNANCNPSGFGLTYTQFASACKSAFSTPNCSGTVIATQICSFIQSNCKTGSIGMISKNSYPHWCFS